MSELRTNAVAVGTSFVGREKQLAEVLDQLRGAAILTLLGPPGTGKSRLAVELGLRTLDGWAGGVWVVDAENVRSVAELCAALGRALRLTLSSADPLRDLGAGLTTRGSTLVVIDDAEGAAAVVGETLAALVPLSPEARFLVTSRVRLAIDGEVAVEVPPLALPDPEDPGADAPALRLLLDRAAAVGANLADDPQARARAGELARRLEGLPLAIELVAPRFRLATPGQILELVPARLGALTHRGRRPDGRHATLEHALAASLSQLTPAARAALAQSTVFADGFDLEAAEAVIDLGATEGSASVLDALQMLRDHSLLWARSVPSGPLRLGAWSVVRQAARALLEPADARAVEDRHARYFLTRAERARGELDTRDEPAARSWLAREHDNIAFVNRRALAQWADRREPELATRVLRSAVVLEALLEIQGSWPLRLALLEDALAAVGEQGDARARAAALIRRGRVRAFGWGAREGESDLREGLRLADEIDDAGLRGAALDGLATQASLARRTDEAMKLHERALEAFRVAGDRAGYALALTRLAWDNAIGGRLDEADGLFERALAIHREVGNRRREGMTLGELGAVALDRGRLDDARQLLDQGLAIDREVAFRPAEAFAVGNLGLVAIEEGRFEEAAAALREALGILRALGNRWWEGMWLGYLALARHMAGAEAESSSLYRQAQGVDHEVGNFAHEGLMRAFASVLEAQCGHGEAALRGVAEASRLLDQGETHFQPAVAVCTTVVELLVGGAPSGTASWSQSRRGREAPAYETRLALRLLERAPGGQGEPRDALIVAESGRWFRPPHGERVDVSRRRALRLLVRRLAEARQAASPVGLSTEDLLAAGWPGERMLPDAGARRVYTALWELRKIGLGGTLVRRDDGYLIDPTVTVVLEPDVVSGGRPGRSRSR